jgi:L-2-hydroxyglutarate oxidase LhgO
MDQVDCAVVGAGVVGLAVARALAQSGQEVWVLEAADAIGTGISSRNSEVIHAGLYYPSGSLKARLCVQGNAMLYAYCDAMGVAYKRCGKLMVATGPAQLSMLANIAAQAQRNGVPDMRLLDAVEASHLESALVCQAALLSGSTGIVDSHALMLALQADVEQAGGTVVLRCQVNAATLTKRGIQIVLADGAQLGCKRLVNAAGLNAPSLARQFNGLAADQVPAAFYAKGNYFSLLGKSPFKHLVYPVPEPGGLGVHLTLDLGGQAKFGPDVQWVDSPSDYSVDASRAQAFEHRIRQYWPSLPEHALAPAYAGIRPKISGPADAAADFMIQGPADHGHPGLVNLFGIESPGLTSALAIGKEVLRQFRVRPGPPP